MLRSCKTMDMCPGVDQRSVRGAASAVTVEANSGVAVPEASEGALCSSQLSTSVAECSFNSSVVGCFQVSLAHVTEAQIQLFLCSR